MIEILDKLLQLTTENEVVEFKEAKTQYDKDKLGQYFSALSNGGKPKGASTSVACIGCKKRQVNSWKLHKRCSIERLQK